MLEKIIKKVFGFFLGILVLGAAAIIFAIYVLKIDGVSSLILGWWPTLVMFLGLLLLLTQGTRMFGLWVMGFFGFILARNLGWVPPDAEVWHGFAAVTLTTIGLCILGAVFGIRKRRAAKYPPYAAGGVVGNVAAKSSTAPAGFLDASAVFGERNLNFDDQEFTGANLSAIFGSALLDLRRATVPADCVIETSAIFGQVDILVPPGVNVVINGNPIFGAVENMTAPPVESSVTITINASAIFGEVEIK